MYFNYENVTKRKINHSCFLRKEKKLSGSGYLSKKVDLRGKMICIYWWKGAHDRREKVFGCLVRLGQYSLGIGM